MKSEFHNRDYQRQLLAVGTREEIIDWLVWNDSNGIFTDNDCDSEEMPRMTLASARALMLETILRDVSQNDFRPVDVHPVELAKAFCSELRLSVDASQLAEIVVRNESESDPSICHSHDFCDGNQCMIDALCRQR